MLPAPCEPLWLRSGEQNLHISAAGFRPLRCTAASALCSPLSANPCGSVPGSKIFTFPPPVRRRISSSQAPGGLRSLLPALREPLWLRSGEQNLHISAARFRPPKRTAASAFCSPLSANPCGSVPGSKIFTFPPPDFDLSVARWLYASKDATAYPRKAKVNPLPIVFFLYKFKKRPFWSSKPPFGFISMSYEIRKKILFCYP